MMIFKLMHKPTIFLAGLVLCLNVTGLFAAQPTPTAPVTEELSADGKELRRSIINDFEWVLGPDAESSMWNQQTDQNKIIKLFAYDAEKGVFGKWFIEKLEKAQKAVVFTEVEFNQNTPLPDELRNKYNDNVNSDLLQDVNGIIKTLLTNPFVRSRLKNELGLTVIGITIQCQDPISELFKKLFCQKHKIDLSTGNAEGYLVPKAALNKMLIDLNTIAIKPADVLAKAPVEDTSMASRACRVLALAPAVSFLHIIGSYVDFTNLRTIVVPGDVVGAGVVDVVLLIALLSIAKKV